MDSDVIFMLAPSKPDFEVPLFKEKYIARRVSSAHNKEERNQGCIDAL